MGDRCRSKYQCVMHTSDGAAVTSRDNTLCPGCIVDIQRCCVELPFLAAALRTFKGGSMKVAYESKVNATHEPAAPLDLHVIDLLGDIADVQEMVDGYEVRDLVMQGPREYLIWVRDVQQRVDLDGVDRALRVRRVHRRATNMTGLAPSRQRRKAPCPDCNMPTLGQWSGTHVVDCPECELSMSLVEYELYCVEQSRRKI